MLSHLRANAWMLLLTLTLCCVAYPLVLWGVGQSVFHNKAQGSLVSAEGNDQPLGSRLIAQPFGADEYFWPRPSAPSYNASASGGSNLGPSNPALRDRVARALGPIVRYKGTASGRKTVQEDVADWVKANPKIVAEWADAHPTAAQAWVNADDKHKDAVKNWLTAHPNVAAEWQKKNTGVELKPADVAGDFFEGNQDAFHKAWPKLIDDATWSLEAVFFEMWLQAHPTAELEQVPADLVMASGSGLDPHITVKGALYQLDRVSAAWAKKEKLAEAKVRKEIEALLNERAQAPLGGLAGVPLINVLEVNLELANRVKRARGA